MFGLEFGLVVLLVICIVAACAFEFVNGFHDTANAVATVIYTNSLKPEFAVVWSGVFNFLGVLTGGIGVAMGIVNLLPVESLIDQSTAHSIAMILALLLSAIIWNLGTWLLGLPSSSTHTLVGSIVGVGMAFSFLPDNVSGAAVNWGKAIDIGASLIISPIFGFSVTVFLMYFLKRVVSKKQEIFKEPNKTKAPPLWIRSILILTCTGVSFFHGQNDGQKGVGLVMLILIGIVPTYFALNNELDDTLMKKNLIVVSGYLNSQDGNEMDSKEKKSLANSKTEIVNILELLDYETKHKHLADSNVVKKANAFKIRQNILLLNKNTETILKSEHIKLSPLEVKDLKKNMASIQAYTDYAPVWVKLMISISLGIGTMVGWKRIVVTIGEKIGKSHLTYAQGASAEMVAASTIGLSSFLGLPVSTTHVLSSGIAGSMVASNGIKNLQKNTVRNILMAWILTFPVSVALSGSMFLFFRWLL